MHTALRAPSPSPSSPPTHWVFVCVLLVAQRMCAEGGCGACVVSMRTPPSTVWKAVNSCLRPVLAVNGCEVKTVEGIGSTLTSLHPVQSSIVQHNATQCGFCTPGFVMNMYSLLETAGTNAPTAQEIEMAQV